MCNDYLYFYFKKIIYFFIGLGFNSYIALAATIAVIVVFSVLSYIIKQSYKGKSIMRSKVYNVIFHSIIYSIIAFIAKYCLAVNIPYDILQDILLPAILYLIEIIGYQPAHAASGPENSNPQEYEDQELAGPEYEVNHSNMQDTLDKFADAIETITEREPLW